MTTHVNAFYGDLEEKKQALAAAQAEVDTAELALKSHPDYEKPKAEKKPKAKTSKN